MSALPDPSSFAETVTPAPVVSVAEAEAVAVRVFGVAGRAEALGSQYDANFVLTPADGGPRALLKFAHPSTTAEELIAQSLAAALVGDSTGIATPRTRAALDGARDPVSVGSVEVSGAGGPLLVRMLDFVEGTPLSGPRYLAPAAVAALGSFAARSVLALAGFEHPGAQRTLSWDLRNADALVTALLPAVTDAALADRVRVASASANQVVRGLDAELPRQVIHGDLTDDNTVGRPVGAGGGRLDPTGIIDFGDVVHSWAVAELAVTCSSVLHHRGASAVSILPAVRAFCALRPLSPAEADALWPLIVARAATLVVSAHHAAAIDPQNDYTRANAAHEHRIFEVATSVPTAVMTALVREAAGFAAPAPATVAAAAAHPLLPGLRADAVVAVDLSSTSPLLAAGRFAEPDAERALVAEALRAAPDAAARSGSSTAGTASNPVGTVELGAADGEAAAASEAAHLASARAVSTRFAERRLTRSFRESPHPHPCAALGVAVTADATLSVHAPWSGTSTWLSAELLPELLPDAAPTATERGKHPAGVLRLVSDDGLVLELSGLHPPTHSPAAERDATAEPAGGALAGNAIGTHSAPDTATAESAADLTDDGRAAHATRHAASAEATAATLAGGVLGSLAAGSTLGVRLLRPDLAPDETPWFTTADLLPGWRPFVLDPTPLLTAGTAPAVTTSAGDPAPAAHSPAPSVHAGDPAPATHTSARALHAGDPAAAATHTSAPAVHAGDPAPAAHSPAAQQDAAALLRRRERHLADVQEHYYADPPEIERGWRHHLFDTDARPYLDMVNNVAAVGHAHPRIADAVARQLTLLNTNSRFNYAAIAELTERLAALLPDPLDTVFLVNSGTEAVDLALRIGWAWSGRRDVVAVREAYHGWSDAADAVSTSVADNPGALSTRPAWVHTLDAPNAYRGRYRGADAARYAVDAVATIEELVAAGRAPASFIAEAFYGNAGGMPLPDGYLESVYAAVRAAGGLCIADEVQVGYGRLGEYFWGFEQQGVRPDIVTVAKAMGNGHPLGAVITTRAIAERYRSQGYFFSSAGGSPVSSVVGTTVLDILRDEGLQENARVVGAHLKRRLEALAEQHELIGAVHGLGLYLGVELVRDRSTREPAPEETLLICERMRELGVIVQPTSDRQCVLKIKPPLTLTREGADFFVDTLHAVLTDGW